MSRQQAIIVQPEGSVLYAHLRGCADGVVVSLCRADRPAGQRLLQVEVIDAPFHLIADRLHDLFVGLARGKEPMEPYCRKPDGRGVFNPRCEHIIIRPKGGVAARQCRAAACKGHRLCGTHLLSGES